jgi:hypothetical protein
LRPNLVTLRTSRTTITNATAARSVESEPDEEGLAVLTDLVEAADEEPAAVSEAELVAGADWLETVVLPVAESVVGGGAGTANMKREEVVPR